MASNASEPTRDQLLSKRARFVADLVAEREQFERRFLARCIHKHRIAPEQCELDGTCPTIDLLMLSGGGDRGAFGTGFLKGWGEVSGSMARPEAFDCVTGVSTGSLISPYAFIGTPEAYETIDRNYRNPDANWALRRFSRALITQGEAMFKTDGLRRFIRNQMTHEFVSKIASAHADGRELLVGTTNADTGLMRVWGLSRFATTVHCEDCYDHIASILTASSAIPGFFPAVEIGGDYYFDGGVTMQLFFPGLTRVAEHIQQSVKVLAERGVSIPAIRVWIIVNNQLAPTPTETMPRWYAMLQRGLEIAIRTSCVVALRDIQTYAKLTSATSGFSVEVRYVCLPDSYTKPDGADVFDRAAMTKLSDIGYEMGTDPSSWLTTVPDPESADTYDLSGLDLG